MAARSVAQGQKVEGDWYLGEGARGLGLRELDIEAVDKRAWVEFREGVASLCRSEGAIEHAGCACDSSDECGVWEETGIMTCQYGLDRFSLVSDREDVMLSLLAT